MRVLAIFLALFCLLILPVYAEPGTVIDRVPINEKVVAISLENASSSGELEKAVALGEAQNIKMTFFLTGEIVEKNSIVVKKAYDKGFEFGNYGMVLKYWGNSKGADITRELAEASATIQKVTGSVSKVVRPPYNYYENNFFQAASANFLTVVRGLDTSDWTMASSRAVVDSVKNNVQNGDIISFNMGAKYSAAALPEVIRELKSMGYQIVTISELLAKVPSKAAAKPAEARWFSVISSLPASSPKVALTFDDGGSVYRVSRILDILKENGIYATFFLAGNWVDNNPQLVQRIMDEGHEVANHSYSHPVFSWLGSDDMENELVSTENAVKRVTGHSLKKYFRPPYGDYNSAVIETAKSLGYEAVVLWNVDTRDWSGVSAETICNTVFNQVSGGSIILFHLHAVGTPDALSDIIPALKMQGYTLTTIGSMLR